MASSVSAADPRLALPGAAGCSSPGRAWRDGDFLFACGFHCLPLRPRRSRQRHGAGTLPGGWRRVSPQLCSGRRTGGTERTERGGAGPRGGTGHTRRCVPDSSPPLPAPAGRHRGQAAAPPRALPVAARALPRPRPRGRFSRCRACGTVLSVCVPSACGGAGSPSAARPAPRSRALTGRSPPLPSAVRRPGEAGAGAPSPGQEETHGGGLHPRLDGVCQRARAQQHSALCGESRLPPARELPQAEKR